LSAKTGDRRATEGLPEHRASGIFVLRTPLLPASTFLELGGGRRDALDAETDGPAFEDALERNRAGLRRRLEQAFDDPAMRDAILVASPSAEAALDRWRRDGRGGDTKVERVLARYLTRASARPIPFGLFAGVSVGELGERTRLQLPPRRDYLRWSRISPAWATEAAEAIAARPEVRAELVYRANPTLYRIHRRWRYIVRRTAEDRFIHSLRETWDSAALRTVIHRAGDGARLEELAEALATPDRPSAEVDAFLDRLLAEQLLVPDLAPPVPGGEPVDELTARLAPVASAAATLSALRGTQKAVAEINRMGVGVPPEQYRETTRRLDGEDIQVPSPVLVTELHKPAPSLSIGPGVLAAIEHGLAILCSWVPDAATDPLAAFRQAFRERYADREVPLAEVLDEDAGIGLPKWSDNGGEPLAERDRLLAGKVQQALRDGAREITVRPGELNAGAAQLPQSFFAAACLEARSASAADAGDFRVWLKYARGPGAASMMTRFAGPDTALREALARQVTAEERLEPDAIHAELASLPQLDYASTLYRPRLREWEIECLGLSGAAAGRRLRLADLLVSVVNGVIEIRLRDGRRVAPALTAPLNLELHLPPAYRFLALVEQQRGIELAWRWGALGESPFLPRVRSGRVLLSPARWKLGREEAEALTLSSNQQQRFKALQELRDRLRVPRLVSVADGDNRLPVDLEATAGAEMLLSLLRGRNEVDLVEVFPDPNALCVEGPEGRFMHELLVPFLADQPVPGQVRPGDSAVAAAGEVRRSFPPGSRWLYAKFYGGRSGADALVRDRLGPLCARLVEEGSADRWFFIRYEDPEPHIRLRLEGDPRALRECALPPLNELAEGLIERRMCWRLALDTYEREVERYGGAAGIDLAEQWFCADSEAAVEALVSLREAGAGPDLRWRVALAAVDSLLVQFEPDVAWRLAAVRAARGQLAGLITPPAPGEERPSFAARFAGTYREERPAIEAALAAARSQDAAAPPGSSAFSERATVFEGVAAGFRGLHERGELVRSLRGVCLSLAHMRINRLLRLPSLQPELRLYDSLERLYASELARKRPPVRAEG